MRRANAMKVTFALLLPIACVPVLMAQGGTYTQIHYPGVFV